MNPQTVPNAIAAWEPPSRPNSWLRYYRFDDGVARLVRFFGRPGVVEVVDPASGLSRWRAPGDPTADCTKSVYNELVCSRLGQLIGAPLFRGVVVWIPESLTRGDTCAEPGAHVGFTYEIPPEAHPGIYPSDPGLHAAAVLVAWLNVYDVDHRMSVVTRASEVLGRGTWRLVNLKHALQMWNWTAESLTIPPHGSYDMARFFAECLSLDGIAAVVTRIKGLDRATIARCFDDVPAEWSIPGEDIRAGVDYVDSVRAGLDNLLIEWWCDDTPGIAPVRQSCRLGEWSAQPICGGGFPFTPQP